MELSEIIERKEILELQLRNTISIFEDETETQVDSIYFERVEIIGYRTTELDRIRIELKII